jgi:S-DNA-T family DNA segregation ATPase FtsK/SpoIIIE
MPKKESSNPNEPHPSGGLRPHPNWLIAISCLLIGLFLAVAMINYSPDQVNSTHPLNHNVAGTFGAYACLRLLEALGASAWLIPVLLLWFFYLAIRNPRRLTIGRLIAVVVALLAGSGLCACINWLFRPTHGYTSTDYYHYGLGGILGSTIYDHCLADALGDFGTLLVLAPAYGFSLLFVFTKDMGLELEKMLTNFSAWREGRHRRAAALAEQSRLARERAAQAPAPRAVSTLETVGPATKTVNVPKAALMPANPELPAKPKDAAPKDPAADAALRRPKTEKNGVEAASIADPVKPAVTKSPLLAPLADGKLELNIVKPEELKKARVATPTAPGDNYKFPPLTLLKEQVRSATGNSEEEHRQNAENLLRILSEFGVEVSLGEIHVGPVITRYELVPAAGVRVEKISGLDKNIALGMRAQSVRILAPIPGKAAVGVEVPNQNPTPVGMREILESEDWVSAKAELPIALGKDVSGKPLISDLAKMPHLLIAGATGSGKSVCINAIVASILYSKSPRDVRLIMVDPKVVELKIFNTLPHMLIPVVTEPKKVPGALKWLLSEMEQRYQIFAKVNVRNIVGFNQRKKGPVEPPPADPQGSLGGIDPLEDDGITVPDRMPYIVAIIDELADLMMVAPAEIETSIARLAQLARAAGIHLIIATQRPSVNVITGIIKANLPSRIAFQVASQVDSRTILDTKGADTLIGRGDLLFSPPGTSRLVRAQGAFVSDEEVHELVGYLKENNDPPIYAQAVQAQIDRAAREDDEEDEEGEDGDLGDDDTLYRQALDVLKSSRRASTSMLQRRLRIGYNRAARVMEMMEDKGIVGPENGSSPREILVDLDGL